MTRKREARRSCNYERADGSRGTKSIVADAMMFRMVASTVVFTLALLAVPTIMAITKQFGWW